MVSCVSSHFVNADKICDYIPMIGTVTNLINLFQKHVILPFINTSKIEKNRYFSHVKSKKTLVMIALLFPFIGNIIIGVYNFVNNKKNDNKDVMLKAVKTNGNMLKYASKRLKDDKDVVLAAVKDSPLALRYAGRRLKEDEEVVRAAIQEHASAFQYASERLKDSDAFVDFVMEKDAYEALKNANERFKNNKQYVLKAVSQDGFVLRVVGKDLKNDKEVVLAAVKSYALALVYASELLRDDKEIILAAVQHPKALAIEWASDRLKDDEEVIAKAIDYNGWAIICASERLKKSEKIREAFFRKMGHYQFEYKTLHDIRR